jgi:hypothetical protein
MPGYDLAKRLGKKWTFIEQDKEWYQCRLVSRDSDEAISAIAQSDTHIGNGLEP